MKDQHQMIKGYRDLSAEEIAKMNEVKALAEKVGALIDELTDTATRPGSVNPEPRWLSIARTQLQQGFMALTRAIAKPESF